MKKFMAAILLFDLMAGLLFLGLEEMENRVDAASVGGDGVILGTGENGQISDREKEDRKSVV